ncbi:ABC transporter permease [Qiania dongpingensis]|uniref:ABC transporter permease n=1 Tax=Qiania dongpingensis TaxID=2763669 RepID=A0A7G9G0N8_9FIRM|nr:ABC transporter permease [Qiania dongpingensis]QNM04370.1 ABC transporter permease [Qiania dongpingensis]
MKQFGIVWRHELQGYVKSKSYIGITVGFALLFAILLSLPSFMDLSGIIPGLKGNEGSSAKTESETALSEYGGTIYLYDKGGQMEELLAQLFPSARVEKADSEEAVKGLVENGEQSEDSENADGKRCGFVVESSTDYRYYVKNRSFSDSVSEVFDYAMGVMYRQGRLQEIGADTAEIEEIYNTPMTSETIVLGKDSVRNYLYTYLLIFVVYFMVLIYGNSVATSVAQEKSNRAMEVLVTSTSSNSLIFGKVLAGTVASFLQVGVIIGAALASYGASREAWNGMLDFVFQIPAQVLLAFAVFGILGYVLYAFCYGVLGALVSKTEDVSRTAGPLMFVFIMSFLLTIFNLPNSDGTLMKILSFIPFTSPNAMFARVAMGNVAVWEIAVSLVLLLGAIAVAAIGGAKIYRMGTLMYGNPIKLSRALKMSREKDQ